MLAVEDAIFALEWGKSVGGLHGLIKRSDANAAALDKIVAARPWLGHLAVDRGIRSKTSVCLTVEGADADFIKKFAGRSEEHTSELQSLMRISYAVFCLKKKTTNKIKTHTPYDNTIKLKQKLHISE